MLVLCLPVAFQPDVADLPTDPKLAAELREVEPSLAFVPALLPLQHELHSPLH
jgi:hypothetical protein